MSRKVIPANSESTKIKSKIPDYAKDFRKEWLCIRGINKTCGEFIKRLDFGGNLFNSSTANRLKYYIREFLKAQELGYIKDISCFYFKYYDVNNIDCLEEHLDYYCDLYCDPDGYEFDQEYYDLHIDRDYPGFKELLGLVSLFNDKVKREELTSSLSFDSDSDSDDDDGIDSDDVEGILSDSDSDDDGIDSDDVEGILSDSDSNSDSD